MPSVSVPFVNLVNFDGFVDPCIGVAGPPVNLVPAPFLEE
jgi:hypothetical protein